MNVNFTDAVRQTLGRARNEAIRLRHGQVGTEHILLGMLADPGLLSTLTSLGIGPGEIRSNVEARSPIGAERTTPIGELPYQKGAKSAMEFAMRAARNRGDAYVRTEHLFHAVLEEETGIGGQVLRQLGLRSSEGGNSVQREPRPPRAAGPIVQISDASQLSIYEQIIAQITEAVATGVLQSGERLPPVRQMADNLDIAPGTVGRAYSELERQGVVITEGARGTRVAERTTSSGGNLERAETLAGLLRPVAVAAFHLGASAAELRIALERAMTGIFWDREQAE